MNKEAIDRLISDGVFPEETRERELVETHISWVILCDHFVYKIKKPLKYSFLDFSTPELRAHFCERELELNRRMSEDLYLGVLPVRMVNGAYEIGGEGGTTVDHALKMRKLDPGKQMDALLAKDRVRKSDIRSLAERIADFHKGARIHYDKNVMAVQELFNDLGQEIIFLSRESGARWGDFIEQAIRKSDAYLEKHKKLLNDRLKSGFYRDVHGDLHTRNIFLLPRPQPFDCIEFNDDYRQIDILNEVAFLCMDLDALGRKDLSEAFMTHYNSLLPVMRNEEEQGLFRYYKGYRANVRAKVNSLRARSAQDDAARKIAVAEAGKYLALMISYLETLDVDPT